MSQPKRGYLWPPSGFHERSAGDVVVSGSALPMTGVIAVCCSLRMLALLFLVSHRHATT
jgi:hypothetical protein